VEITIKDDLEKVFLKVNTIISKPHGLIIQKYPSVNVEKSWNFEKFKNDFLLENLL